jgi:hypothetical protein
MSTYDITVQQVAGFIIIFFAFIGIKQPNPFFSMTGATRGPQPPVSLIFAGSCYKVFGVHAVLSLGVGSLSPGALARSRPCWSKSLKPVTRQVAGFFVSLIYFMRFPRRFSATHGSARPRPCWPFPLAAPLAAALSCSGIGAHLGTVALCNARSDEIVYLRLDESDAGCADLDG